MTTEAEFRKVWENPEPWVECNTSGSTGTPKLIRLTKRDMRISACQTNSFFNLGADSVYVCPMDYTYVGAKMMLVRADAAGGTLISPIPSNHFHFEGRADLLAIVPSQVDALLADKDMAGRTGHVIIGGAPLDGTRRQALLDAGIDAWGTYGMTETCSHVALAHISTEIFTATGNNTFSVDSRGCLAVDMPGRDISSIQTNDIVELKDPTHFRWLGRADNVINSGGLKIQPEPLERIAHGVLESMRIPYTAVLVQGVPSAKWGTTARLAIETTTTLNPEMLIQILDKMRELTDDPRKCPKDIVTVPLLPRTASGKLNRKAPL